MVHGSYWVRFLLKAASKDKAKTVKLPGRGGDALVATCSGLKPNGDWKIRDGGVAPTLRRRGVAATRTHTASFRLREVVETISRPSGCRAYEECFSFILFKTSCSVPLKGPGVSILMETSAAANFRDSPRRDPTARTSKRRKSCRRGRSCRRRCCWRISRSRSFPSPAPTRPGNA